MAVARDWTQALQRLIAGRPLAWLVSNAGDDFRATPLPLRPVLGAGGAVDAFLGHFARSNPQVESLRRQPAALALFMGPQGYISPAWLSDRTQAPTWNYAAAVFRVEVRFIDGPPDELLRDLVGAMEEGRPDAWRIDELGERYQLLAPRIIGFRARVIETRPAFKLGDTEPDHFFAQILDGLAREGQSDLRDWMSSLRRADQASAGDAADSGDEDASDR